MDGFIILLVFALFAVVILPIILASSTNSRVKDLSRQINDLERKVQESIEMNSQAREKSNSTVDNAEPAREKSYTIEAEPIVEIQTQVEVSEIELETIETIVDEEPVEEEFIYHHSSSPASNTETDSWWDRFKIKNPDLEKFIGENLISKIGIAVLVLGIGFFVKYAIDKNWINEYARVGIGILSGAVVLLFAHRLRERFKAFSSVLVAGAIAIFYFTITIGFQEYRIFSQTVAFGIMVCITAFSVFISIVYNRQELAVLALIGGFAAPFMVSTGEGNYKVLFTYILILDLGMMVMAFVRKWNAVHLLAYIFTILLYGAWYLQNSIGKQPPYEGALIFASLFYLTFFISGIINNVKFRLAFNTKDIMTILLLNFLFCAIGLNIFSNYHRELKGTFIIVLAAFNLGSSWLAHKNFKADRVLVYLLIGLTLSYATLAAPVQLDGNHITLFWAAEAVLLMWLAQRSEFKIFRFASVLVHALMLISLAMDWQQIYLQGSELLDIFLNKGFITSIVCLVSLLSGFYLLRNEEGEYFYLDFRFESRAYRRILIIFAMVSGYIAGFLELIHQLHNYSVNPLLGELGGGCYHSVFSFFLVYALLNLHSEVPKFGAYLLGVINTTIYLAYLNRLPFEAILTSQQSGTGLFLHYLTLVSFASQVFLLAKDTFNGIKAGAKKTAWWIVSSLAVFLCSSELMLYFLGGSTSQPDYDNVREHIIKTGFPILWGILAFIFLFIGMRKQQRDLRIISLVLLFVTLVKLFTYDINQVSQAGKIAAFILLGILLLVMSFMYQKIKSIILDDEK